MKKDLLKRIGKALILVLVLGLFVSNNPIVNAEDETEADAETVTVIFDVKNGVRKNGETELPDYEEIVLNKNEENKAGTENVYPDDGYKVKPNVTWNGRSWNLGQGSEWNGIWNIEFFPNYKWVRITARNIQSDNTWVIEYLPIDYKIAFDANGGEGSMDAIETKYDVEVDLPECTMTNGDLYFADWNTKPDGSGDTYYDMDSVKNLTAEDGATVTLYAQWQEYPVYVYEDIKEVSFTITPPKAGDTVTIDVENYEQNPQPEIILPSDAKYTNEIDGEVAAYWIKSEEPGESFAEGAFEGTYKAGDTFYAVVGLFIDNGEVRPTVAEPNRAATDVVLYAFSNDLKVNVKGADVVSTEVYIYGYDEATVVVKGVIEAEPDPEPDPDPQPDPQPQPTPIVVPKTGVDGFTFSSTSSLISLLGVCLAGLFLNKRR